MMKKLNDWFEISEKEYIWYILQGYEIIDEEGDGVTWQLDGLPHREDGPAYVGANGTKIYHVHGDIHRIDGPALERADGTREWWLYGSRHRTDGPAVERADGSREWYVNGELHRTDGPAVERADGTRKWYLNGEQITEAEWKKQVETSQLV